MFTARRKIQKEKGVEPDEFEESVAQVSRGVRAMPLVSGMRDPRQVSLVVQVILPGLSPSRSVRHSAFAAAPAALGFGHFPVPSSPTEGRT